MSCSTSMKRTSYLMEKYLSEMFQSAYKRFHSAETVLFKVQDDILHAIDNGKCVAFLL